MKYKTLVLPTRGHALDLNLCETKFHITSMISVTIKVNYTKTGFNVFNWHLRDLVQNQIWSVHAFMMMDYINQVAAIGQYIGRVTQSFPKLTGSRMKAPQNYARFLTAFQIANTKWYKVSCQNELEKNLFSIIISHSIGPLVSPLVYNDVAEYSQNN